MRQPTAAEVDQIARELGIRSVRSMIDERHERIARKQSERVGLASGRRAS